MRGDANVALRFADDIDLLQKESKLDDGHGNGMWPRKTASGELIRSWDRYHQEAMNEINRRLRSRKALPEPFRIGRLDPSSRERLRDCAACFALHFLFMDADNGEDFPKQRASYYWSRGGDILEAESNELNYDSDGSGKIEEIEKNQAFMARFIRG